MNFKIFLNFFIASRLYNKNDINLKFSIWFNKSRVFVYKKRKMIKSFNERLLCDHFNIQIKQKKSQHISKKLSNSHLSEYKKNSIFITLPFDDIHFSTDTEYIFLSYVYVCVYLCVYVMHEKKLQSNEICPHVWLLKCLLFYLHTFFTLNFYFVEQLLMMMMMMRMMLDM